MSYHISMSEYLKEIVGIKPVKKQVSLYLDIFNATGYFKNLLLVGAKGTGKTKLAREIGKELISKKTGKPRDFYEINCASLSGIKELFFEIGDIILQEEEATFYFDECEQLSKDIGLALLSILEVKNEEAKVNEFKFNELDYFFNFGKVTFIFATTNAEKMLEPLVDRLELVNIPAYEEVELMAILDHYLDTVQVDRDVLKNLSGVVRGNPRACVKLTKNIKGYLEVKNKNKFTLEDCKELYFKLSIYPMGLNYSEVQILQILRDTPNCSLTRLGAKTGKNVQMLRRFEEVYLQKAGLIEIRQSLGRNLTTAGSNYLRELKKQGLID